MLIQVLIIHSDCFRFSRDHWERPSCREGSMENDSLPRFCASHMACSWSLSLCVIAFSWKKQKIIYAIIDLYKNWVLHFLWPLWLSLVPILTPALKRSSISLTMVLSSSKWWAVSSSSSPNVCAASSGKKSGFSSKIWEEKNRSSHNQIS